MTRRFHRIPFASASGNFPFWFAAAALVFTTGCRNTTNTAMSPLGSAGPLSPLAPVQGTAPLSPIQPTSGFSTTGAPTRVPPPPTGSYNSSVSTYSGPANYGATSNWDLNSGNLYAASGVTPNGATIGSTGITHGVTELNPLRTPTGVSGNVPVSQSVSQAGWIGDDPVGSQTSVSPANSLAGNASNVRAGGMQPIDLTSVPYPPGYVPPQQRNPSTDIPQTIPYPQALPAQSAPASYTAAPNVPLGQSTNWTTERTADALSSPVQTAGRISNANLPSTEPYQSDLANDSEPLQWRRPSPRF